MWRTLGRTRTCANFASNFARARRTLQDARPTLIRSNFAPNFSFMCRFGAAELWPAANQPPQWRRTLRRTVCLKQASNCGAERRAELFMASNFASNFLVELNIPSGVFTRWLWDFSGRFRPKSTPCGPETRSPTSDRPQTFFGLVAEVEEHTLAHSWPLGGALYLCHSYFRHPTTHFGHL